MLKDSINQPVPKLPAVIDYAAGSGHFITEVMEAYQDCINNLKTDNFYPEAIKTVDKWKLDPYSWAGKYVYGIEKDYRLVKVAKVGRYFYGDGLAQVIHGDGLDSFEHSKSYVGLLSDNTKIEDSSKAKFSIVVSNPPYSVDAFKGYIKNVNVSEEFELYKYLTDRSSEIECLFVERTKQLLKDGGVAGIILPSSILTNSGIYTKTREILLKYFEIIAITELGSNTFMATGTNTVVLFLRRRSNFECANLEKSVDKFFENHTDVTVNNIETPVAKYVNYVWEGLSFEDYLTLTDQNPNENVQNHDLYKEYKNKIKVKTDKEFWNKVIELEKEKIYYFILAYPQQKIVVVKTGEKDAEKQFLGYEFSNRRGSEGIHAIQRSKTIDECTKLYDTNSFDNPQKASTYILKAFENAPDIAVDETLKDNISKISLLDMMTFDRADFEKNINLNSKKKVKIESKWNIVRIGDIANTQYGYTDKATDNGTMRYLRITDINDDGSIQSKEIDAKYITPNQNIIKQFMLNDKDIVIARSGTVGKSAIYNSAKYEHMIFASYLVRLLVDKTKILPEYLFYFTQVPMYWKQVLTNSITVAQPNLNAEKIKEIKLPLPPLEVQQKIVDEIEKVEKRTSQIGVRLNDLKKDKDELLEYCFKNNHNEVLIKNIADVKGGKRIPKGMNTQKTKTDYPYIKVLTFTENGSIDIDKLEYITEDIYKKISNYTISHTDIYISIAGTIGLCGMIPKSLDGANLTENAAKITVTNKNINSKWLLYILQSNTMKNIFQTLTHGLGTPKLSLDRIKNIKIPLVNLTEQQKIVSKIEELESQIADAQRVIDNSKQKKQEILDKYLK